jgi:hypothetical protein
MSRTTLSGVFCTDSLGAPVASWLDMKKSDVPIGSPCEANWSAMTPASGGRFCGDCKKVVHHLSKMTQAEATALLRSGRNDELCVRYAHDRAGAIVFADRRPLVPASLLHRAKRVAAVAAAAAIPAALAACASPSFSSSSSQALAQEQERERELQESMGGVSAEAVRLPPEDAGADAHQDAGTEDPELPVLMGGISADALDPPGPQEDGGGSR